ncbi:hypothetical protein [Carnobacterium divergens]|uniref:hypothetical protein n=1 Tax=Carnobacterium divergens TaxID=2748 RepID=UPI00288DA9D6|nr:hypothetical protein [Carnobacterium divergens]MDT2011131.1 hypothetical protein [Carnobacterium divergens]
MGQLVYGTLYFVLTISLFVAVRYIIYQKKVIDSLENEVERANGNKSTITFSKYGVSISSPEDRSNQTMITNSTPPKSKKRNPGSSVNRKWNGSIKYDKPSDEIINFFNDGGDK